MANRFVLPLETPVDATGAPYPGGKLFFYASGTSTKLNTYSDSSLTIANSNPIVLDSAGRFPNAIFLQNLAYKVVLAPADDTDPPTSPIWTQDPVYTSDYSARAKFTSGSGSPNGSVAGTAGSATTAADAYWDYTNNILYVCTSTGTATTAVWTAINASTAAAVVPPPQGYITPVSGTAIISSDSVSATTVYYTPYTGVLVPIYNGATFIPTSIVSELQYTLTSSMVANNIYDLFVFSLSGVPTLGSGPSWSAGTGGSIAAGSCARGTGAGGAAISRVNGIWVNTASMTIRYGNGTTTTSVAASQATYVGSIYIDGTNGQVSCYRSFGQSRKWGIWNAYNRAPIVLTAGDATASWSYTSSTYRPSNNNTANSLTVFCGLAEEISVLEFIQRVQAQSGGSTSQPGNAIGWNSTTSGSQFEPDIPNSVNSTTITNILPAKYIGTPSLGINTATCLEANISGTGAGTTFYGTQAYMRMTAEWRG
jgi:hypothetical protein